MAYSDLQLLCDTRFKPPSTRFFLDFFVTLKKLMTESKRSAV